MKSIVAPAIALASIVGLAVARQAWAELAPDEVAVIAMAASPQSRDLAEYYVAARGIPKSQILLLAGQPGESVSRVVWEQRMRPAIADWLVERKLDGKIRCFVTSWDVPLKIGKRDPNSEVVVVRKRNLAFARQNSVIEYGKAIQALRSLGPGGQPGSPPAYAPDVSLEQLAKGFDEAAKIGRAAGRERV